MSHSSTREVSSVLVTGASSGIGLHVAQTLASDGHHVAACARRVDIIEEMAAQHAGPGSIVPIRMDVTSIGSIREGVAHAVDALGAITVLVNNAGIAHQSSALDVTEEDFDRIFTTNVRGSFFVAQTVAKHMVASGLGGRIVNIASVSGLVTMPGLSLYGGSKAAVIHLTRSLAREWARYGITVNALCPTFIRTPLNEDFFASPAGEKIIGRLLNRRIGIPEDLIAPLRMLISGESSRLITGAAIPVDDGYSIS